MAIFRLKYKKGKNIAHLTYINRDGKYKKKGDLIVSKTFNLPAEFQDINDFYKTAKEQERANANIYREFEISLPKEYSNEKNKEILDSFLEAIFEKNFVYNYAIHKPDDKNIHAHVMFSERKLDGIQRKKELYFKRYNPKFVEKGGLLKDRLFQKTDYLLTIREKWEHHLNMYLEADGLEKVSSKTLEEQKENAIKNNDFDKAKEFDREAKGYKTFDKYKKDKADYYFDKKQNENINKYLLEANKEIQNKKIKEFNDKVYKMSSQDLQDLVNKKIELSNKIIKLDKKIDHKKLKKIALNKLTNNEYDKLLLKKRKLFSKKNSVYFRNELQKINKQIYEIEVINKYEISKEILKMKKEINNNIKEYLKDLKIIDKTLEYKLSKKRILNESEKYLLEILKTKKYDKINDKLTKKIYKINEKLSLKNNNKEILLKEKKQYFNTQRLLNFQSLTDNIELSKYFAADDGYDYLFYENELEIE